LNAKNETDSYTGWFFCGKLKMRLFSTNTFFEKQEK